MNGKTLLVLVLFLSVSTYVFIHVLNEKTKAALKQGVTRFAWPLIVALIVVLGLVSLSTSSPIKLL